MPPKRSVRSQPKAESGAATSACVDAVASSGFVQVVLPVPLDKVFDYRLPQDLLQCPQPGSRVHVPFGRTDMVGWVIGYTAQPEVPQQQIKTVYSCLDQGGPVFPADVLRFTYWLAQDCGASWGQVLHAATPPVLRRPIRWAMTQSPTQQIDDPLSWEATDNPFERMEQVPLYGSYALDESWPGWIERVCQAQEKGSVLVLAPDLVTAQRAASKIEHVSKGCVNLIVEQPKNKKNLSTWVKARDGLNGVWVGLRSLVFWPVKTLSLIVLIGSDEPGHRQEQPPHYRSARAVFLRAAASSCGVVWCDAIPSVEAWHRFKNAPQTTQLHLPALEKRPRIRLMDRRQFKARSDGFSLPPLMAELRLWIQQNKRLIFIHNRSGFSTHIVCPACKQSWRCPRCDRLLIQRYRKKVLMCPSCGTTQALPQECPHCGSKTVRFLGRGTEKLESEWVRFFPSSQTAVVEAGDPWPDETVRVVFTTHACCDRWDWPDFDISVFLNPDTELYRPHADAAGRLFKRMLKTARHTRDQVVLVSLAPEHPVYKALTQGDITGFLDEELHQRKELGLPPYRRLFAVLVRALKEEAGLRTADRVYTLLQKAVQEQRETIEVFEPVADHQPKLRDRYRFLVFVAASPQKPLGVWLRGQQGHWPRSKNTQIVLIPDP